MTRLRRLTLLPLVVTLSFGCAEEEEPDPELVCPEGFYAPPGALEPNDCDLDVLMVGQVVASIDQGGTYLQPVNSEPFVQQHGPEKLRVVYGSTKPIASLEGKTVLTPIDLYRTLDPADLVGTFDHELPVGTMFVHWTPEGPPYGAMVKQAEGTDPDNNDWHFGRYDEYGYPQPIESYDTGQTCRDCHVLDDRPARTDMLWGVPRASL